MKNWSLLKLMAMALGIIILISTAGCCEDVPYVIVPEPDSAPPVIVGTVTTNGGGPLEGAVITFSGASVYTTTSDSEGRYSVEVASGQYSVTASKNGYSSKNDEVETAENVVTVWNALLAVPEIATGGIKAGQDTDIEVRIPPLVEEAETGTEVMTVHIPEGTTGEDDELIIEFFHDASYVEDTKVSRLMRLVNVYYYLKSGNPFLKPITVTAMLPAEPVRVLEDGEPISYTFDAESAILRFVTQKSAHLTMDYYVDITEDYLDPHKMSWQQDVYDNYYGSAPMHIVSPEYEFFSGGHLKGNHVLINSLAAVYTGVPVQSASTAEYPLDLTLPVGGKLMLSGYQPVHVTYFNIADGLMYSMVTEYQGAVINAATYNRQHSGGSN